MKAPSHLRFMLSQMVATLSYLRLKESQLLQLDSLSCPYLKNLTMNKPTIETEYGTVLRPLSELGKSLSEIRKAGLNQVIFSFNQDYMREEIAFTDGEKYVAFYYEPEGKQ